MIRGALRAALTGGSALAGALAGASPATAEILDVLYGCERGVDIPAIYLNADGDSVVLLFVEGRRVVLPIAISASGARYARDGAGSGYVWWSKGRDATLAWFDAEHGEEVILYAFCSERRVEKLAAPALPD